MDPRLDFDSKSDPSIHDTTDHDVAQVIEAGVKLIGDRYPWSFDSNRDVLAKRKNIGLPALLLERDGKSDCLYYVQHRNVYILWGDEGTIARVWYLIGNPGIKDVSGYHSYYGGWLWARESTAMKFVAETGPTFRVDVSPLQQRRKRKEKLFGEGIDILAILSEHLNTSSTLASEA